MRRYERMDCQIGSRRISHHLMKRCRHSINDILRHDNDKYKDAVDEYISYLEKEDSMEKYYPGKLQQFNKMYRAGQPVNDASLKTPLYRAICEHRTSTSFTEAVINYYYLFVLAEEYNGLIGLKPSHVPFMNHAATVQRHGQYPSFNTIPFRTLDAKHSQDELEQLKKMVNDREEDIRNLQSENREKDKLIDELRGRLSGHASKKLVDGNPNFTDLSDKYRPTKIAEYFHSVYDDEWTNAFESLLQKGHIPEEEVIYTLFQLVWDIYSACSGMATEQRTHIIMILSNPGVFDPRQLTRLSDKIPVNAGMGRKIVGLQRELWTDVLPKIQKKFKYSNSKYKEYTSYPEVEKYVDRCVELIWLMRITDPPMVLKWPDKGDILDTNLYNCYKIKGSRVSYPVWPATLLHESGPVIYKGYAKPI